MESTAMRAILIGAGLLITMITISAVMMYYNSARDLVTNVGDGSQVAQNYSNYIRDLILVDGTVTGSDVKNILNYFYDNPRTTVTVEIKRDFATKNIELPKMVKYNEVNNSKSDYTKLMNQIVENSNFLVNHTMYSDSDEVQNIIITEL